MEKRIKVSGYIELPAGQEIPAIGSRIFGSFVADADGDHRDKRKRRGGEVKIVRTVPATLTEASSLDRIVSPDEDDDQASLDDAVEDAKA